eukprot:gb/GEZJ01003582.1/.p2 GENE.gb/GEZJ01003582.1/~~gb/GEZJ01003582.1/.p2  ORF type:complete len:289 (-),score=47.46 gb/GEZJ01003582.1/:1555-2421(-)
MVPPLLLLPLLLLLLLLLALALVTTARRRRATRAKAALRGKHVWVIGASRGIGRATAERLAALGATLTLSSRPSPELDLVAKQLRPALHAVLPFDVTDTHAICVAAQRVSRVLPVDVVLANAGINHRNLPFVALHVAAIDAVLDTNFRSVAHLFSRVLPAMRARGGLLCAVSSLAAYRGVAGASVYAASKAALTSLCQSLSVELYNSKVSVVCVHPGFVHTSAISSLKNPKPLLITESQAAEHVVEAIAFKYSHYGFPWLMEHVVLNFSACLPTPIYNFVMSKLAVYG